MRMSLLGHTVQSHRPNKKSPAPTRSKRKTWKKGSSPRCARIQMGWTQLGMIFLPSSLVSVTACGEITNLWTIGHVPSWISLQIHGTIETEWWNAYLHSVAEGKGCHSWLWPPCAPAKLFWAAGWRSEKYGWAVADPHDVLSSFLGQPTTPKKK